MNTATEILNQVPKSIRASIHQDAIHRVSEFFNATTHDIMNELLQNARRAGASRVDVTTGIWTIKVSDDGAGIADPTAILAFGQTGWDDPDALSENPAGMGIYSLARCERVEIVSRTKDSGAWKINLTPAHFVGDIEAPVVFLPEGEAPIGTSVTFTTGPTEARTLRGFARHYPLPVTVDGEEAEREDFLHAAIHTEEWRGVRIGVYEGSVRGRMNFHGVVVEHPNLPVVDGIEGAWNTRADVLDCPELKLTLPARREIVETPFTTELRRACREVIYRVISRMDEPADLPFGAQQEAASMGINLPDASPKLRKWEPRTARETQAWTNHGRRHTLGDGPVLMGVDAGIQDLQALGRAAERGGFIEKMYEPDPKLSGYSWYDALVSVDLMEITITDEHGERDLEEIRAEEDSPVDQRPRSILITLHCSDESEILLWADTAFLEGEDGDMNGDRGTPLVTLDSDIRVHELRQLMMDACFHPDEDGDADSIDTQEYHAELEYEGMANRVLHSQEEAAVTAITSAVQRHIIQEIPQGMNALVRISRGGVRIQVTVDLEESEKPAPEETE